MESRPIDFAWQGYWTYTGFYTPLSRKKVSMIPGLFGNYLVTDYKWIIRLEPV